MTDSIPANDISSTTSKSVGSYKDSLKSAKDGLNVFAESLKNLPKIFSENMYNKYGKDYKDIFENNLLQAKGGLIVFLILITLIYHVNYGKLTYSKTYIQSNKFWHRAGIDAIFTGIIGFIATSFIMYTRNGTLLGHFKGPVIVGIVLALFNLVQESSGFNRYLNKANIEEGKGNYAIIDKISTADGSDQLRQLESGGDPFINSIGYFSIIAIGLVVLSKTFSMVISTYYGYKSGNHSIDKIIYRGLTSIKSNNIKFIIELLEDSIFETTKDIQFEFVAYIMCTYGSVYMIRKLLNFSV